MSVKLTHDQIEAFVRTWFGLLSEHAPISNFYHLLSESDLLMKFPEATITNIDQFAIWYEEVGRKFCHQNHIVENISAEIAIQSAIIRVEVSWSATKKDGNQVLMRAIQRWEIAQSTNGSILIRRYIIDSLTPLQLASFAHVGLSCRDPAMTERFYSKHFTFHRVRVVGNIADQVVFLRNASNDLTLELFLSKEEAPGPYSKGAGPDYPGFRHLAFQVADVDAKLKELGKDVVITVQPMSFDEIIPGWKTAWVSDPDGRIIEISQGYVDQSNPPQFSFLETNSKEASSVLSERGLDGSKEPAN